MYNLTQPEKPVPILEKSTKETIEKLSSNKLLKEIKKDTALISNHKIKK